MYRMPLSRVYFIVLASLSLILPVAAFAGTGCGDLAHLTLPHTKITSAETVAAGVFNSPPGADNQHAKNVLKENLPAGYASLPSFCRVAATITPTSDSDIRVEVWMPTSGWNNRFNAVGNGGWAGSIQYAEMAVALAGGYATASTDTGHTGNSGAFGLGHPEKLVDYSYRAVHEMTVLAKTLISSFYGNPPKYSVFVGCSLGGHQGLNEADKYPTDYDGIVAGAPSLNWARLNASRVYLNRYVNRSADSAIPPEKYALIHKAVLDACDGLDGVRDGVLEDPTECRFDPKTLECRGVDGPDCLSPAQVKSAEALYSSVKSPKTGEQVYPKVMQPGSELGWDLIAGPEPLPYAREALEYLVYKDPTWNWHDFNPSTDLDAALAKNTGLVDFDYPTLKPFFDRGGKLLLYHGWSDPVISPAGTVDYFKSIKNRLGPSVVENSIQLYMVPGMTHCWGGPGTDVFDVKASVDSWLSTGKAPAKVVASHKTNGAVDRSRPLCPYGQVATYKGKGSTDDAQNFACATGR